MIGPWLRIAALPVKIYAVAACVAEHPVYYHPDAQLFCGSAQGGEVLLPAQQGVDFRVISRVIAVVGMALENRVQV